MVVLHIYWAVTHLVVVEFFICTILKSVHCLMDNELLPLGKLSR